MTAQSIITGALLLTEAPEPLVERVAQFLHDEGGFDDAWAQHSWPDHPEDTGQREGGYVKIVPRDVQAKFRDVARRLLMDRTARAALSSSISNAEPEDSGEVVQADEGVDRIIRQIGVLLGSTSDGLIPVNRDRLFRWQSALSDLRDHRLAARQPPDSLVEEVVAFLRDDQAWGLLKNWSRFEFANAIEAKFLSKSPSDGEGA